MYWIIIIILFLSSVLALIKIKVKDSSRKINNALLMFYFSVAIWMTASIAGIYTIVKMPTSNSKTKTYSLKTHKEPYSFILMGMLILGSIYVVRRREWAEMFIEGIGAWKGKDLKEKEELLLQHALLHPEDREWIEKVLLILHDKEVKNIDEH